MALNNQRLHLYPEDRVGAFATVAAMVGGAQGFYKALKLSSLQYLTENAHRLPQTVGGWYFYHKKKNYVMLKLGAVGAASQAVKYLVGVLAFLLLELGLDSLRGTIDFANTTAVGALAAYVLLAQMSRVQRWKFIRKALAAALAVGLAQDAMIYARGGYVWYAERLRRKASEV